MTPPSSFATRAIAEIAWLHHVLQAWFRAEGAKDARLVLEHFDDDYTMVTTAGKLLTLSVFRDALPTFWGSRPGLVMEITNETIIHEAHGVAMLTYNERQHLNGAVTDRYSTVLLLDRGTGTVPAWRHLQETMIT
jgi:hypothetical protein